MDRTPSASRILVVDDVEDNRAILARRLGRLGYQTRMAESGEASLPLIAEACPDLVLLDYMMPGMTGLDALREIRRRYDQSALPVIMVTARADDATVVECLNAGATDFVAKPIAFPVLRARLEAQLERRRSIVALGRLNAELEQRVADRTRALEERNRALSLAFRELEQADQAKSIFLAGMSHELRTPLNAILGLSELLHKQVLGPLEPAKYTEFAAQIHDSGRYLLDLVSAVLEATRQEQGETAPATAPVEMRGLVAEAVAMVRNGFPAPAPRLDWTGFAAETVVRGDRGELMQVVTNILSNAMKFTNPQKSVRLTCRVAGGAAEIEIADEGPGIPEDRLRDVVKPFVQVSGADGVKQKGVGLGLHIANLIVKRHRGTLVIRNGVPAGLLVRITLPLSSDPEGGPSPR